jgi:hypothetical protein
VQPVLQSDDADGVAEAKRPLWPPPA